MSVYDVIARLPVIAEVRNVSRALAVLDAVLSPDPQYRYYTFDSRWSPTEETALMRSGSGDEYSIVFSREGAVAQGFDHESPLSPYQPGVEESWPGLFVGVPDSLAAALDEPAFLGTDGQRLVTVCFWRTSSDSSWQCGPVEQGEKDGADWLFQLVADGRPEAYLTFAEYVFDVALELDAIRHVYAQLPLTEEVVRSLNPEVQLSDLKDDIAEIGYPRS